MTLNRPDEVRTQYSDSSNLAARAELHARYSTNPYGWSQWAFDRMKVEADACVLEVGCGPGWLWRHNISRMPDGVEVVATDMSVGMVDEARSALDDGRFTFAVADVQSLPFASESFDVIVANHMLYHVPDLDLALSEFVRALRPRGRLVAATNGQRHLIEINEMIDVAGVRRPGWGYIRAFGLETGPEAIARHFDAISIDRYEDALDVTLAEPVVDYIRSMSSFWRVGTEDVLADIRRRVQAAIDRDGAFHISKDAGVITARKP
jgi:SAM-dependent methyltransferase